MERLDFDPVEYVAKKFKLDKMRYSWIGFILKDWEYGILLLDISTQNNNFLDFHIYSVDFFDEFIKEYFEKYGYDNLFIESISVCDDLLCRISKDTCLDLDSSSCNWYRECLESKYECCQTFNGALPPFEDKYLYPYAIDYAEKYCVIYNQNYEKFSNNGKKWVDEVRGCLYKSLAEMLSTQ
jgi:hypothetical protein